MEIRYFYAHAKGDPDEEINGTLQLLTEMLTVAVAPNTPRVIAGRDDFNDRAKSVGGWAGWARSVGAGTFADGTPVFHAYIVPYRKVGKATAGIITDALGANKPVALFENGRIRAVRGIVHVDKKDWVSGWELQT
jgi:hypothetical protein